MDKFKSKLALSDIILGGQDGLVNVLGLTLGLFANQSNVKIILVAGLAAGFAEAISMGAVAYTSSLADRDYYLKSMQNLRADLLANTDKIRERIRKIFIAKMFTGQSLDILVDAISGDKDLTANLIMSDELKLQPIETKGLLFSSFVVTISAFIGSLIPLIPFLLFDKNPAMLLAVIICSLVLFIIGAYKAITLVGIWWRSGLQMLLIGILSAFAGFVIGFILKVN